MKLFLYKLDKYGIRGHAYNFLRSFLSNKMQYTTVKGVESNQNYINCGVPQGSVLGPLLF